MSLVKCGFVMLGVAGLSQTAFADSPAPAGTPANQLVVEVPALAAPTTAAPKERIICRREVEIGSLVRGVRRCGTMKEWRAAEDAAQNMTDRIQSDKGRMAGH